MCGHFGIIYKPLNGFCHNHVKAFVEGLYMDALRGEDATGACLILNNGSAQVIKEATEATWFLGTEEWKKMSSAATCTGKALLGHNRKATVGGYKDEHAHPFVSDDDFVFLHNGSLSNWKKLGFDTDVDSDALGKHIRKAIREGVNLGDALSEVNGAYACVWYDLLTEKVQIVRNKERPLWLFETDACFVWASEPEMAALACRRNSMTIKNSAEVPIDTLISFELTAGYNELKPKLTPLTIKKALPPVITTTQGAMNTGSTNNKKGSAGRYSSFHRTKKDFKRWRAEQIGEHASYWVEDYSCSDKEKTVWRLEGTIELDDCVDGVIKVLSWVTGSEQDMYYDFENTLVGGIVSDCFMNDTTKEVYMVVKEPKPLTQADLHKV